MMIAGAAAFTLVAARIVLGPFAAIVAVAVAGVVRAITALMVGPVLGAPTNVFELCLGAAVLIELLALTPLIKNRVAFGAVGGLLVATVGLWLESLWIDAVYIYPWPTSMWPEALAMAVPVGIAAGACGALLGRVLPIRGASAARDQPHHRRRHGRGDRRGHRQRPRRDRPGQRHRHNRSHRGRAGRRPDGRRRGAHRSARPRRRQSRMGVDPVLAGRPRTGQRIHGRPTRTHRARHLPDSRTGAGPRNVEDVAARAGRAHDDGRPDLPAQRPGHRRRGTPGRGVLDPRLRPGDHHPAAGAELRSPVLAVRRRVAGRARVHAGAGHRTGLGGGPDQQVHAGAGSTDTREDVKVT